MIAMLLFAAASPLTGDWTVELILKPGEAPYTKPMTLALNDDGTVAGSFYRSPIVSGRWRTSRGRTCVKFRTKYGKDRYRTAACLDGEIMRGQTRAEGRSFRFDWYATRAKPSA